MAAIEYDQFSSKSLGLVFDMALRNDPFYLKIKNNIQDLSTVSFLGGEAYKKRFDRFYRDEGGAITLPLFGYKVSDVEIKHKGIFQTSNLMTFTDDKSKARAMAISGFESESKWFKQHHYVIKIFVPYSKIYYHYAFALDLNYRAERNITVNANGLSYKTILKYSK